MRTHRLLGAVAARLPVLLLAVCSTLVLAQEQSYALRGTVVTPTNVIDQAIVLIAGDTIRDVGKDVSLPHGTKLIETAGYIYPGLIDLHNHVTWNVLPHWRAGRKFLNRYEWQNLQEYKMALGTPHSALVKQGYGCAMERYAEVKALTGGATSQAGLAASDLTPGQAACLGGIERELGVASRLYATARADKLRYEVFPLSIDETYSASLQAALKNHELNALLIHLGEGNPQEASAMEEYWILKGRGLLLGGVSLIHGSPLQEAQFQEMAKIGVGLIWSPRSEFELYGATTDVAAAKRAGIRIALAPDWSATGSDGMIEELNYASTWNSAQPTPVFSNADMVRMATINAAQLAGVAELTGEIETGKKADLLIIKGTQNDPYSAVLHASPADVKLIIVGGYPAYGDADIVDRVVQAKQPEKVNVCGAEKTILFNGRWIETVQRLQQILRQWGQALSPLAQCN